MYVFDILRRVETDAREAARREFVLPRRGLADLNNGFTTNNDNTQRERRELNKKKQIISTLSSSTIYT